MYQIITSYLIVCLTFVSTVTFGQSTPHPFAHATNQFRIGGMNCDGCARGIASELRRLPGVLSAEVTFSNKFALVIYDTNRVSPDMLKKTIVDAGYDAKLIKFSKGKSH